jgi:hypothetical protein
MDWLLLVLGGALVWVAVALVRVQSSRQNLPRPLQDEMLFGKGPVSDEQRAFAQRHMYYGVNSKQFLAVVIGGFGVWLLLNGLGVLQ